MRSLGVALASLGLLDALLVFTRGWRSTAGAVVAASACAAAGASAVGCSARGSMVLGASVGAEAALWVAARRGRRPLATLAALSAALLARISLAGLWVTQPDSLLDRWVAESPFGAVAHAGGDHVAYVAGALVFLAAAGNTFVRLLLRSVGSLAPTDDKAPGGGRVIGSIERVLIFALGIAGEATAATLIISAKGILRFAEVRAAEEDDVDAVTEYVLVGSLASYALALAFVPFAMA